MNQSKKTELRLVSIDEIKPWEHNPRLNDEAVPMVEKSIRAHGYLDFIEIDEKFNILAGHTRLKALQTIAQNGDLDKIKNIANGKIPVLVHFEVKNKDAYRLANNKTGEIAEWDLPILKDILTEFNNSEINMDITGFSKKEIENFLKDKSNSEIVVNENLRYNIIIECENELQQTNLLTRLQDEGINCRPLIF